MEHEIRIYLRKLKFGHVSQISIFRKVFVFGQWSYFSIQLFNFLAAIALNTKNYKCTGSTTSQDITRNKSHTRSSVSRDAGGLVILVTMVSVRRHSALKLKKKW